MFNLLAVPLVDVTPDTSLQSLESMNRTVGATINIMTYFGYMLYFILFIVGIVLLVKGIKQKPMSVPKIVIGILMLAFPIIIVLGTTVLSVVWSAAGM